MKKQCSFCGHTEMIEKRVQYIYRRNGRFLIVNDVTCKECTFCNERYFDIHILKQIESEFDSLQNGTKKPKQEVTVPVEEFTELAQ